MIEPYRVRLAFRAIESYSLPVPFDAGEIHVESVADSTDDFIATIHVDAESARNALDLADATLRDLLACFALRGAPYRVVHDARRTVQLVDPEYVADGPIPPFQVVSGVVTDLGASMLDPTGELRRQRRVVNQFVSANVGIGDVSPQVAVFTSRSRWDERTARAMSVLHAAECAQDPAVRFVLNFAAFEILTQVDGTLIHAELPTKAERKRFRSAIRDFLKQQRVSDTAIERWSRSIDDTHAVSAIDVGIEYLRTSGESLAVDELRWLRTQRGAYVHVGRFDRSTEAHGRREEFRHLVRRLLQHEVDATLP